MAIQVYRGNPNNNRSKKPKKVVNGGYSNSQLTAGLDPLAAFIALQEGFLPSVTRDQLANGLETIGFGATSKDVIRKYRNGITLDQAKKQLQRDINVARNHARKQIGEDTWRKMNKNQQDAMTSYAYNFPFLSSLVKDQERFYSPKMIQALRSGNWREAARQMDAGWNQAAGLRKRRMLEQEWFLRPMSNRKIALDESILDAIPDDFEYMQNIPAIRTPMYAQQTIPDTPAQQVSQEYIPVHMPEYIANQPSLQQEYEQPYMPIDYSALFTPQDENQYAYQYDNQPAPLYYPIGEDYSLPQYKYGKDSINIKPENRGKFTETMRRTGKTAEELSHSKNPLTRRRAIFALNARKWHH